MVKGLIYAGQSGRLRQRLFYDHLPGNGNRYSVGLLRELGYPYMTLIGDMRLFMPILSS